jgi:hypothetical protein
VAGLAFSGQTNADDKDALKRLEDKGAKVTTTKGAHSISVGDCTKWTEADYKALGGIPKVTSLSFGPGFTEASLPLLTGLTDLEVFGTNGMQMTDEGVKAFTQFPKLQRLSFFHPPRNFTGAGLDKLAELKSLEDLTVAGSFSVGDDALASISKIKSLKRLRVWHAGNTNEGVKRLKELPALESLALGQRLTYTPPACPNDETIALLLEMKTLKILTLMEARYGYESLVRLKQLPDLKQLTLTGVDISEADFERLKKDMPNVRLGLTKPMEGDMKRIDKLFSNK